MKILIQHRHYENEISGVLTYINFIQRELESNAIEVKTISTAQNSVIEWLSQIIWADVVHMNSNHLGFALLCKLLHKKIIIKYHYLFYQSTHTDYQPMSFEQRLKTEIIQSLPKANFPLKWKLYTVVKWARLFIRLATSYLADCHTACSHFLAESYAFKQPIHILYNPIELNNQITPKTLQDIKQPYCFVFVGRLSRDKGVDVLLQATQILQAQGQDFQVLIIGDGTESKPLQKLVSELGVEDRVQFLGQLPHADVMQTLRSALALVVPSRWQDPAPYVVLEASSVETCSIVSKMGGLPEMVGAEGLLFDNEDASGLATCMKTCLENPQAALELGIQASQFVAQIFSPAKASESLLSLCRQ